MKLALKLAYKNLIGAGLRTWLNVGVLAFAYLIILFFNGLTNGWSHQAQRDGIRWEFGNGHLLNPHYDPYDPFSVQDGHGTLEGADTKALMPMLVQQGSIYPDGRMVSILLKGIPEDQTEIAVPIAELKNSSAELPVMLGERMAKSIKAAEGDKVLLRWRDHNGTFDAKEMTVAHIFNTEIPTVDNGTVWLPLDTLWHMTNLQGEASLFVASEHFDPAQTAGWKFLSQEELLKDTNDIINAERFSDAIIYLMLLAIALIAVFDTQVLSVFRRQREIGTYVALGMTRTQVVTLFTVEGSMYSIFAVVVGSVIGIPFFEYLASIGIGLPESIQSMGMMMGKRIFPLFSIQLIIGTVLLIVATATLVSYLPARKIARMNAVEALKGKLQ
ncbi:MAG: ABC transporter permease [Flavobacteriales bacterium]|jgi:ABC-type lipoprotein release transport system permease subunit|nr:ABC transporter permease [Flavobacteriales bacterium]MBK6893712.1 ABC transporter permease [Flavobacteriales bacterium]MBK7248577.1 ABC transporter permease [Flavobacteriales bacterium]QQS73834.1 MAG: ABC transporter permease [Flavobacteriales bacterium]HQY01300.1 FtsX-like permease family protein [Flavobacteriales bacterium]